MSSTIGNLFRLTTFGESHGPAIGGVIDGCPSGLKLDLKHIQSCLDKRKPGTNSLFSNRRECDEVKFLSGILDGVTLGTPIGFLIENQDHKSSDYIEMKDVFRPSHADFAYEKKYGIRDYRGGGRASARETANWVVAGSIASQILHKIGVSIYSYVSSIGDISITSDYQSIDLNDIYKNNVRCPSKKVAQKMEKLITKYKKDGDTIGGEIFTVVKNAPFGLGEPVFNKLEAGLAKAILGINACKGIAFGSGFASSRKIGSQENDSFIIHSGEITTRTNNSGGVQGGISNGEDICFHAAFKPVSTIMKKQDTVNKNLEEISVNFSGRHDSCVVPRAVPIIESLTAIVILDFYLLHKTTKLSDL